MAIVGPDGAGKTTLARALVESLPVDARYVYLGLWQKSKLRHALAPIPGARLALVLTELAVRSMRSNPPRTSGVKRLLSSGGGW